MDCTSCSTQLPLPPPLPSNVPPLLFPPPPPLSSTPPPPLSRTPPTPRRRTRRSSKGRWFKSNGATVSAVSLSSVSFVGFVVVIYRQYFKPEEDKPPPDPRPNESETITVSLPPIKIVIDKIEKPQLPEKKKKIEKPPPPPPPPPPPCCHSCASDWTPSRRPCYDSYVPGWTQAYCVMEVTEPVNVERYSDLAEYMWSKLCYGI